MTKQMKNPVNLVLLEEHHEAFFIWKATQACRENEEPMTLLHVDEHADMALPRLRKPCSSFHCQDDLATFTYSELTINDFIWPAVYDGMFNKIFWLKIKHEPNAGAWRRLGIKASDARAVSFELVRLGLNRSNDEALRVIEYAPLTISSSFLQVGPLALDIDLDYFAWNKHPDLPTLRLEVTESTFREFKNNRYHPLRISPGTKISAITDGERFFLKYEDVPQDDSSELEPAQVSKRIEDFLQYLDLHQIDPDVITVCRSLRSGYTPRCHINLIESHLLAGLSQLYSIEQSEIQDWVPASYGTSMETCYA